MQSNWCQHPMETSLEDRPHGNVLIAGLGPCGHDHVPLDVWLEANPSSEGASVDAMCRFIGEGDLPNLSDLDGLREARQQYVERSD